MKEEIDTKLAERNTIGVEPDTKFKPRNKR